MVIQKGEIRQIGIEVVNTLGQDFTIETAEYEIIEVNEETSIETGFPTIQNKKIFMLFSGETVGSFYLVFKYHIGAEIIKAKLNVKVE